MKRVFKKIITLAAATCIAVGLFGCSAGQPQKVVIYTNADEEAIASMEKALKADGFENKYIITTFGTSELGGKLMAEGDKLEAGLVTMSSYFIESAQQKNKMFVDLTFDTKALNQYPSYYTPILANTGSIFVNTEVMKQKNLAMPTSVKDLTKPEYNGLVSIPDIMSSSTAWLLVQSIITQYGKDEGKTILKGLIDNCGPHIESSGSGPIKKVRAGEVAAGFGLRHQAVMDKAAGKPIDYIDPVEGNFSLTESVAVVKKDSAATKLAMDMAAAIIKDARNDLLANYPVALYEGEEVSAEYKPANAKQFESPLTVPLLEEHQQFWKDAKGTN